MFGTVHFVKPIRLPSIDSGPRTGTYTCRAEAPCSSEHIIDASAMHSFSDKIVPACKNGYSPTSTYSFESAWARLPKTSAGKSRENFISARDRDELTREAQESNAHAPYSEVVEVTGHVGISITLCILNVCFQCTALAARFTCASNQGRITCVLSIPSKT